MQRNIFIYIYLVFILSVSCKADSILNSCIDKNAAIGSEFIYCALPSFKQYFLDENKIDDKKNHKLILNFLNIYEKKVRRTHSIFSKHEPISECVSLIEKINIDNNDQTKEWLVAAKSPCSWEDSSESINTELAWIIQEKDKKFNMLLYGKGSFLQIFEIENIIYGENKFKNISITGSTTNVGVVRKGEFCFTSRIWDYSNGKYNMEYEAFELNSCKI